ncbi:TonB-dependent receptor domain-containing protein [Hymenobacter sp. APR13]|uniref:TonB-dependent receptor domain-containing protein n=1 Tax=Hymenobacter sp. APR13 TaxID=1356852 RepID=UPI0004E058CB|nr:TonB-dependent receptor [Hymenobacter sp. APR13]AII54359.1 hypothetical protein N008_20525 [Hymenobacter sp. APR13]
MRYLPFLLLLGSAPVLAQTPAATPAPAVTALATGTARLTGQVLDSLTAQPVPFATVAVLPVTGTVPLAGAVADEQGRFQLRGLPAGPARLRLSFLGYRARELAVAPAARTATELGALPLAPLVRQLAEVTVTGERDLVENRPDRTVYNAEKDPANRGGSAADVLRRVPQLSVDPNGNVQLRGSGNVQVLINGRPSGLVAAGVADAIRQLPAGQIKAVEVITSPSARYDAEGSAGIINLVLRKETAPGLNGTLGASAGNRSSSLNGTIGYRRGNIGLSGALGSFGSYGPSAADTRRLDFGPGGELRQQLRSDYVRGSANARLGLDYAFSERSALALNATGTGFLFDLDSDLAYSYAAPTRPDLAQQYQRDLTRRTRTPAADFSATYTRSFAQPRREWSLLALHTLNRSRNTYDFDELPLTGVPATLREAGRNLARNLETTLQTDYAHPLGTKVLLETGGKSIRRRVLSDFTVARQALPSGQALPTPPGTSGAFDYRQLVWAGYSSATVQLHKQLSSQAGLRLEHTDLRGLVAGEAAAFAATFTNLLPSLSLSYAPATSRSLRASYTRRIQRPTLSFLNPYPNLSAPGLVFQGNPTLVPELTDNYELAASTYSAKGTSLSGSLFWRRTGNAIEQVRTAVADDLVRVSYANAARNASVGLSLYVSAKPTSRWSLSGGSTAYYQRLRSAALPARQQGLVYSLNLNTSYQLPREWSTQLTGFYSSPRLRLQGEERAFYFYSLSLQKQLWARRATLSVITDNPLGATVNLANSFRTPEFAQQEDVLVYVRGLRLSLDYRFGKAAGQGARAKRAIRNDDAKPAEAAN